jgi:hypothetical protein
VSLVVVVVCVCVGGGGGGDDRASTSTPPSMPFSATFEKLAWAYAYIDIYSSLYKSVEKRMYHLTKEPNQNTYLVIQVQAQYCCHVPC